MTVQKEKPATLGNIILDISTYICKQNTGQRGSQAALVFHTPAGLIKTI